MYEKSVIYYLYLSIYLLFCKITCQPNSATLAPTPEFSHWNQIQISVPHPRMWIWIGPGWIHFVFACVIVLIVTTSSGLKLFEAVIYLNVLWHTEGGPVNESLWTEAERGVLISPCCSACFSDVSLFVAYSWPVSTDIHPNLSKTRGVIDLSVRWRTWLTLFDGCFCYLALTKATLIAK